MLNHDREEQRLHTCSKQPALTICLILGLIIGLSACGGGGTPWAATGTALPPTGSPGLPPSPTPTTPPSPSRPPSSTPTTPPSPSQPPSPTPTTPPPPSQPPSPAPTTPPPPVPTPLPSPTTEPTAAAEIPPQPTAAVVTGIPPLALDATWQVLAELGDRFWRLATGPAGEVWAIGQGGLVRFGDAAWQVFPIPPDLAATGEADHGQVSAFVVTGEDAAFVGTREDGLYRFEAGSWIHDSPGEGWPYEGVVQLAGDVSSGLWALVRAAEGQYLVRFDGQTWQLFAPAPPVDLGRATGLALGPGGELWLSLADRAPYRFDGTAWLPAENGWLEGPPDLYLAAAAAGPVWVGNSATWARWDGQGWQGIGESIPAPFAYPVAVDAHGGAWGIVTPGCYWCKMPDYNEHGAVYADLDRSCRFTAADGLGDPPLDPPPDFFDFGVPRPDEVWDIALAGDGGVWFITQGKITVFRPEGPVCDRAAPENVRGA
jgi:hypothetical protein